jgi:hypothetical protein
MPQSVPNQQSAVGQGLARGLLADGVEAVSSDKESIELAFGAAWREWRYTDEFPNVRASPGRSDLYRILQQSAGRRGIVVAAWNCRQWLTPYRLMEDLSTHEAAGALEHLCKVPWYAWQFLARGFVDNLRDDQVRRSQ